MSALAFAIHLGFGSAAWGAGPLPQGATVVNGQVAITKPTDTSMQINASGGSIVNWQQFSIGAGNQVRIALPSSSSAILNRVTGPDASQLLGSLQSNGRVFLINPNGIVVGSGARVDTNSFIASTLNLADADFLAGKLRFLATTGAGGIRNDGVITAGPGGRIALIAPDVQNTGIIQAPDGQILLAAGRSLEIASLDFEGVTFEIQAPTDSVLNLGKLLADNGAVSAFAGSLRNSGEIRATRMVQDADGRIVLSGSNDITLSQGSITAANGVGAGGSGGSVRVESLGTTRVAGSVSATGAAGLGGNVQILGDRVALEAGARVDASGASGGGRVLVGGDFQGNNPSIQNANRVYVDADANLKADAVQNGNGGQVVVWADENTRYFGSLSARGGATGGNGGSAEVSGKQNLQFAGSADLSAPAGTSGSLLLDPLDILVSSTGGVLSTVVDQFSDFAGNVVTISPTAMNNVKGNVTLQAERDIYFNSPVALTTSGAGITATAGGTSFNAAGGGQIYMNQAISTTGGNVTLRAVGISGSAAISTAGGAVDIKTSGSENYSGAITTAGGAVRLEAGAGSVSSANVNAGSGAITLTTTTGSISSSNLTGGTITLAATGGSVSNVYVAAATQVNASSSNSSIYLLNYNSQPLRVGTISSPSTVELRSDSGFLQATGGSVTASLVNLYNGSSTATTGSLAAPLQIAAPRLSLSGLSSGMQSAAHIAFVGSPTLTSLSLNGNLAALSATTISGAANLSTFSLGVSNGALSIAADSGAVSGLSSGLSITVSDAGITAPTLNVLDGNITLSSAADLTIGNLSAASLYATAKGAVSLGTVSTTGNSGIYVSTNACTTSYTGCAAVSPITAATLSAAGTGSVTLRTYDNGDITVSGSLTARSASLTAGNQYYITNSYPYYTLRTANNITIASATTSSSFTLSHNGIGNVTLGSLAATGNVNVYAGSTYLAQETGYPYGRTLTTANQISINLAEPSATTSSFSVSNSGVGDVGITGAIARPSGSVSVETDNGNVTIGGNISASSSVSIYAGNGALTLANVTSTNNSVTLDAGTTLTVGRVSAGAITDTRTNAATLRSGGNLLFESVTAQANPIYGSNYGSVTLTSSTGSIQTSADNAGADITASGHVTLTANDATNGALGNSNFANPLDIVSGTSTTTANAVTLSAGKNVGALGKAVNVDTVGTLSVTSTGGQFFVAAKALDSATQRSLTSIAISASAAGIGNGATSTLTSQNLSVSASSDGSTLTIGDVVQSAGALNAFRFTALNSGLTFGNVNLATTGYNQLFLTSSGALTQTSPVTTNNLTAGAIVLNAGTGAITLGNVVSANAVGNEVNLTGGAITAGSISGRSVKVAGAAVSLGQVTSLGTTKYPNYVSVPRLGTSQYVTDELRITATGALSTGNISSATSVTLSGVGVSVGGGTGTVTGGVNDNYYTADQISLQSGTGTLAVGNVGGYDVTLTGATLQVGAVTAVRTLTAGNTSTASLSATSLTNSGTITAYGSPSITVNAGSITTGALNTSGSLNITANSLGGQTYAPGATVTASSTTIRANNGINLSGTTLTSPTVTLIADSGNITAPLTNTTNLTLYTGGTFSASSTAAISTLVVTANGGVAGAGAGSSVRDVSGSSNNEILKVVDNAGTLELTYKASTGATRSTYNESNASLTTISATTASNLAAGSNVTITSDNGNANVSTGAGFTIAGGNLSISTGGDITLSSVSTGSGSVTATSRAGAINLASVTTAGPVSATAAGGDVTLTSVNTGGGSITASATGSTGNVNVTSAITLGGSVTLSSANGSIVAQGAGLHLDTRTGAGAASGTATLTAATGSVGSGAAQFKTSGPTALVVNARDAINVDVANTDLTSLTVTTTASGSGAIAITNSNNFNGLAIDRVGGTDINLSALSPRTASVFSLTTRDGNLNVLGDISNVTNLTLNAGYNQSTGNLTIAAPSGGARSVVASGALTLIAGGNVVLAGGAASTDSLTVQSGNNTTISANGDIQITADGGSVLLGQSPQNFVYTQTLTADGDIVVRGGQGTASAQVLSLGGQTLSADGDVKILGGAAGASGGFAKVQSSAGTQTVSANNLVIQGGSAGAYAALQGVTQSAQFLRGQVSITGGSGAGAYAEMKGTGTGTQTVGYQSYFYNSDFTDGVTVQGGSGSGAYASLASAGRQNVYTTGNMAVLAGSGVNAHADITAANRQNLGDTQNYSSYNYTYRPTDSVLVQASGTGTAKITAGSTQVVLAGTGGIRVLGGSGTDMNALIETTGGSQEIGSSSTGSEVATAFITVQAGAGGSAGIKASGSQTLMTGGNLDVLGGSGASTTAFIESTAGSQNIGYTYIYSNDVLDTIRVSGGTGTGAAAWIKAATGQTLDAGTDILVTGGGTGAYADISNASGTQTVGNQNSSFSYDQTNTLALTGGSGSGAYARIAALGGSQTLRAATGISFTGGALDGAGAWALAASGQTVGTAGTLALVGGGGNAANPNETGLRNTTSGTQSVSATAGITLAGGVAGSSTWIKQAGSGTQTISTNGSLLLTAPVEGADAVSITAGAGGQTISVGSLLSLNNTGAGTMQIDSLGNQTLSAASLEILNGATATTSPQTSVRATGNQRITLNGSTNQNATLTVANLSGVAESQAFLEAGGTQVITMDYLKAGLMQVGSSSGLGIAKVYSTGDQTLVVGELLVQGGVTALADSTLSAGSITSSTMLISTLGGPVRVLGGAAGSATVDPLNLNVVSNGSIQITGGTTSTAGSNVTAGVINMTATNGNMAVIGGGATASVLASTTATVAGVNTFNLTNSGGLTFSGNGTVNATAGGSVLLGAACTGCASGLVGPFSVTAPAAAATSVTANTNLLVTDPAAYWDQASLDLAAAGYELVVAEDGSVITRRRSLVQCY